MERRGFLGLLSWLGAVAVAPAAIVEPTFFESIAKIDDVLAEANDQAPQRMAQRRWKPNEVRLVVDGHEMELMECEISTSYTNAYDQLMFGDDLVGPRRLPETTVLARALYETDHTFAHKLATLRPVQVAVVTEAARWDMLALIQSYETRSSFDALCEIRMEFRSTGPVTRRG